MAIRVCKHCRNRAAKLKWQDLMRAGKWCGSHSWLVLPPELEPFANQGSKCGWFLGFSLWVDQILENVWGSNSVSVSIYIYMVSMDIWYRYMERSKNIELYHSLNPNPPKNINGSSPARSIRLSALGLFGEQHVHCDWLHWGPQGVRDCHWIGHMYIICLYIYIYTLHIYIYIYIL